MKFADWRIKRINGFDVFFVKCDSEIKDRFYSGVYPYWNAYVRLPKPRKAYYGNETFRDKDIIGIDTAHSNNTYQTEDERFKDAIAQIREVIGEYKKNKKG